MQAAVRERCSRKLHPLQPGAIEIDSGERDDIPEQVSKRFYSSTAATLTLCAIDDLPRLIDRVDFGLLRCFDVGDLPLATSGPELVAAEDEDRHLEDLRKVDDHLEPRSPERRGQR